MTLGGTIGFFLTTGAGFGSFLMITTGFCSIEIGTAGRGSPRRLTRIDLSAYSLI